METKAHHFLIGSAVLLCLAGGVVLAILLSQIRMGDTLPYRIYFSQSVAGLNEGGAVRVNGVEVGAVEKIELDPGNPKTTLVTVSVATDAPINEGSVASLESKGFTGNTYVGITGGSADAPPLEHEEGQPPPVIPSKASGLSAIMDMAPQILDKVSQIADDLQKVSQELASDREEIGTVLANAADTAKTLDRASAQAADLVAKADTTVEQINQLVGALNSAVDERVQPALANAERAASSLADAADQAERLIAESRRPVREFTSEGLPQIRLLVSDARRMVENISSLANEIKRNPSEVLFGNERGTFRPEAR